MATIYNLDYRLRIVEKQAHNLYCYIKNNPGSNTEIDPIFSASSAASITQSDIDNWNTPVTIPNLQQAYQIKVLTQINL